MWHDIIKVMNRHQPITVRRCRGAIPLVYAVPNAPLLYFAISEAGTFTVMLREGANSSQSSAPQPETHICRERLFTQRNDNTSVW